MAGSRYEPLGFGFGGMRTSPTAGNNVPVSHGSHDSIEDGAAKYPRPFARSISNNTIEDTVYTGYKEHVPAQITKRQRTGSSLQKVASSIWSSTSASVSRVKTTPPWQHEFLEKHGVPPSDTVRYFDHRRQRRRLFANSTLQWMLTALVCAALAALLYSVSKSAHGVSISRKHAFNAIITGLSLVLGLNLASSMKTYANMLRWRLLASGYRTLDEFERILECESQLKTLTILWACRTRGRWFPNKIQFAAAVSILINLALQVFTALLGLTYSIDVSEEFVNVQSGLVSIADVNYIGTSKTLAEYQGNQSSAQSVVSQLGVANQMGIESQDYTVYTTAFGSDNTGSADQIYADPGKSVYWYRFIDENPLSPNGLAVASDRTVNATATCKSYPVVYGGQAGFQTDDPDQEWAVTWVDDEGYNHTLSVDEQATGATTWMSNQTSDCGARCTQIYALQAADNLTAGVPFPRFWSCLSYVSNVSMGSDYPDPTPYQMPDTQAWILAGAIGWSGIEAVDDDNVVSDLQMRLYQADSQWSAPGNITEASMSALVMQFTAGAIAAMDANGPRVNVTGHTPVSVQLLNVQWKYAGAILAGIPVAQALILALVIVLGDRAIIKDGSPFSTARLLRPIVDRLGDTGCLLTSEEIVEKLGNYRVIYGVREPEGNLSVTRVAAAGGDDGQVRHLDILDEAEGLCRVKGRMPIGRYDGMMKYPSAASDEIDPLLEVEEDNSKKDAVVGEEVRWDGRRGERRMSV